MRFSSFERIYRLFKLLGKGAFGKVYSIFGFLALKIVLPKKGFKSEEYYKYIQTKSRDVEKFYRRVDKSKHLPKVYFVKRFKYGYVLLMERLYEEDFCREENDRQMAEFNHFLSWFEPFCRYHNLISDAHSANVMRRKDGTMVLIDGVIG